MQDVNKAMCDIYMKNYQISCVTLVKKPFMCIGDFVTHIHYFRAQEKKK